jgi:hypothetical protein
MAKGTNDFLEDADEGRATFSMRVDASTKEDLDFCSKNEAALKRMGFDYRKTMRKKIKDIANRARTAIEATLNHKEP